MRRPPIADHIQVIETSECCWVVVAGDPTDWLVCFEKSNGFPALAWAENMANVYNTRRAPTLTQPAAGAHT
jgi:hypothetical protein